MPKVLFFDIDLTLVGVDKDGNSYIPQSAIDAIRKTRANGNLVFIATGRSMPEIEDRVKDIGFDGYVSAAGNCLIYNNEIILRHHMSQDASKEIVDTLDRLNMAYIIEGNNALFISKRLRNFINEAPQLMFILDDPLLEEIDYDDINKICFFCDEDTYSKMEAKYKEDFTFFKASYVKEDVASGEISLKGVSKGTAIKYLLEYLNIDAKDVYGFGDSDNDIEMFKICGTSIALGKHRKSIDPYVDFVTKNIEDDGIEYAMKHYDLI